MHACRSTLEDPTGLERLGVRLWQARARDRAGLALLLIDIDHFKRVNDTQGHAGGDQVLHRIGELLTESTRGDDLAVRLGGEEFLVVCTGGPDEAARAAERLRREVEHRLAPITVSVGFCCVIPDADDILPESLWSAVATADQALYAAKRAGRNRAVGSSTPVRSSGR